MTAAPARDECKSCPNRVFWADTDRGKSMLVDAEPVQGGNLRLTQREGRRPLVSVVAADLAFGATLYRSHFVTCPAAAEHRHRERARRERLAS